MGRTCYICEENDGAVVNC